LASGLPSLKKSHRCLFGFILLLLTSHRNLIGIIRFSCFIGKCSGKAATDTQRAVLQDGGCTSRGQFFAIFAVGSSRCQCR
jgi:hypothetical protein